jgi:hypothetical protein
MSFRDSSGSVLDLPTACDAHISAVMSIIGAVFCLGPRVVSFGLLGDQAIDSYRTRIASQRKARRNKISDAS